VSEGEEAREQVAQGVRQVWRVGSCESESRGGTERERGKVGEWDGIQEMEKELGRRMKTCSEREEGRKNRRERATQYGGMKGLRFQGIA